MSGFVKIYGSKLITSSLWDESPEARLVFVAMLAIADATGYVDVPNMKALARVLNLPVGYVERALSVLMAPDKGSRTPSNEGRRVLREDSGWRCVNYEKYREFRSATQEATRLRVERHRAKVSATSNVGNVHDARVTAEAEAEAEAKKIPPGGAKSRTPEFVAVWCEEWKAKYGDAYEVQPADLGAVNGLLKVKASRTVDGWRAICRAANATGRRIALGVVARNPNEWTGPKAQTRTPFEPFVVRAERERSEKLGNERHALAMANRELDARIKAKEAPR